MPEVAANATHATLVSWNKAQGDSIQAGESIADVETDKAVLELPVEQGGVVGKLLVANGTEVAVGEPIALVLAEGETLDDAQAPEPLASAAATPAAVPAAPPASPAPVAGVAPTVPAPASAQAPAAQSSSGGARIFSSPVARLLAKQHGIDLATVAGSGPKGRVTKHDVVQQVQAQDTTQDTQDMTPTAKALTGAVAVAAIEDDAPARVVRPNSMRRTIAKRLSQSKSEVPHFYLRARCQVDALLALRKEINAARETPVSINDFVVRAAAVALAQVPQMNVSWREDGVHEFERVDISVAVDTPNGLYTPIVRDAANKPVSRISAEIRELAKLARNSQLQPSQYQGGTFSVSNLGMFGVDEFDAIINPPQAAILAVGGVKAVALVKDGEVVVGRVMDVVLSIDHRAVDGAVGARYLAALRALIEHPLSMLV